MKKEFEQPELIIVLFTKDDIISSSSPGPGYHYDPDLDEWILD